MSKRGPASLVLLLCAACRMGGGAAADGGGAAPVVPNAGTRAMSTAAAPVTGSAGVSAAPGRAGSAGSVTSAGTSAVAQTAGTRANAMDAAIPQDVDAGPESADAGPRSSGPGDWSAGDYPKDLMSSDYLELTGLAGQNGNARQYKVHVPPSYDPKRPMPLVVCMHGLGQDPVMFCVSGANMPSKSDSAGFLLAMPFGYQNSWNAGTCCGGAVNDALDDVGFIRALIKELSSHLNIDLTRVYATGLSNGGYMSYRLACEASDIFAAVAPGAGAIGMNDIGGGTSPMGDLAACAPKQKVSVLDLHGTADPLIPYEKQKPSLERIAMANGCMLQTQPATQPASAGDTTCVSYTGCPSGIDVIGCSVKDGGHVWFGSSNCGTGVEGGCDIVGANSTTLVNTDAVWSFFSAHARP